MRGIRSHELALFVSCFLASAVDTSAQSSPTLTNKLAGSGFQRPVLVTAPPGESNRVFVVEQHTGNIRILTPATGSIEPEPFLTVAGLTTGDEQGLLGLAFHPQYQSNGWFYVNYTTTGGGAAGQTEIARFQALGDPRTALSADPASKSVALAFNQPESNHNGGWLGFGTDRYLYISSGDGGGGDDRHGSAGNGQNRNSLLGKILRIDVDHGAPYEIPAGNPFVGLEGQREEIWAFGLRNPWRCSIDRLSGDLWIGDVGQRTREEIDLAPAGVGGLNFGWRPREGAVQNPTFPSETPVSPAVDPVHDYPRSSGISVVGGYVYRGAAIPGLEGTYLFADYGSARIWSFRFNGTNAVDLQERTVELNSGNPKPISNISSFGEDGVGELYLCDISDGEIYQIIGTKPAVIQLLGVALEGTTVRFNFQGTPGQSYMVEFSESVAVPSWQPFTNLTATASASNLLVTDETGSSQRFYRVRTP